MPDSNPLSTTADNGSTLGFDLGKQHLRIGLLNAAGTLRHFQRFDYSFDHENTDQGGQALLDEMLAATRQFIAEQNCGASLRGLGLALPGLIQHETQRVIKLPYLPSLVELNLGEAFARAFNTHVTLVNNAQAATLAEMQRGRAQGVRDWLYLHLGANVSAGLVLGGQLQYGQSGLAGALGEMMVDPERTGDFVTLESMVSAENVARRTQKRLQRDSTSSLSRLGLHRQFTYDDIVEAAEAGDDLARLMLQRTGKFIGFAIGEIINLLNLSLVVVGGAPAARPYLVSAIADEARLHTHPALYDDCRIVAAELGAEATVIGAALLARRE
ncbi:MAG: ROK family protein [Acidobacteria bacterium]|nr:ROK family protein [Acidobacteriota bacterium]